MLNGLKTGMDLALLLTGFISGVFHNDVTSNPMMTPRLRERSFEQPMCTTCLDPMDLLNLSSFSFLGIFLPMGLHQAKSRFIRIGQGVDRE